MHWPETPKFSIFTGYYRGTDGQLNDVPVQQGDDGCLHSFEEVRPADRESKG